MMESPKNKSGDDRYWMSSFGVKKSLPFEVGEDEEAEPRRNFAA